MFARTSDFGPALPEAIYLKNFATSITGENFANSDKLGVVGRRCVKVSVANGTPAPHNKILPKISRCPADGLWLQPAGTLRSGINLRKFSAGKFSMQTAFAVCYVPCGASPCRFV